MTERLDRLETLAAFAAGELDDDARVAVEELLAANPAVAEELRLLAGLDALLADDPVPPLPDGAHDRLLAALAPVLDEELGSSATSARRSFVTRLRAWLPEGPLVPRLAAGVAALVVIAGAGIGLSQIGGRDGSPTAIDVVGEELAGGATVQSDDVGQLLAPAPLPAGGLASGRAYDEASALALLQSFATQAEAPAAAAEPHDGRGAPTGGAEDHAFAKIDTCADKPFEAGDGQMLHAEVGTYNDDPALIYIVERSDGSLELWILEAADCGLIVFETAE